MVNHKSLIEGLVNKPSTHKQLSNAELVEASIRRDEAVLTNTGALRAQREYVDSTRIHLRSPKNRFLS